MLGRALGSENKPLIPIRGPKRMGRTRKKSFSPPGKKWWCPQYMFDGKEYPMAVSGAGYVMTYVAAQCIYNVRLAHYPDKLTQ